jgi:hypothetical protein
MLKYFLLATIQKILAYKQDQSVKIPTVFKQYLENLKDEDLIQDIQTAVSFIRDPKKTSAKNCMLLKAVHKFFTSELARKIDYLDSSFYLSDIKTRREFADKLIKSDSELANAIKDLLVKYSYQQLANEIQTLGAKIGSAKHIVIQTPRELDQELKKEIRAKFVEKDAHNFPIFQINQKLIGGMRVFEDGKTIDNSWVSRVYQYTSLTSA